MKNTRSLKWQKILWSVVIVFALTLVAYIKYSKSDSIIAFGIYPYVLEPYVIISSLAIALFRIFRIISNESFLYIFAATVSVYIGSMGVYLNSTGETKMNIIIQGLFCLNILMAIFIFFDVFKKREAS